MSSLTNETAGLELSTSFLKDGMEHMRADTPIKNGYVQVPESSPSEDAKVTSSSPLKNENTQASILRDRFVYKPSETSQMDAASGTGPQLGGMDADVATLTTEYPDFSETLIKAVFKSNSYNLELTRERLEKIQSQKSSRSWAWRPGEKKPTSRLMSLGSPSEIKSTSSSTAYDRSSGVIASPEKSSKITVEKQKTSIFDRYSHVMNQRHRPTMESVVVDPSTVVQLEPTTRKRRKLVRADNVPQMSMASGKKSSVSLSDEDEDEISGDEVVSGEDYQETTPDVNIDEEILKFLNEANERDIADLADTSLDKASMVVKNRPFGSLIEFSQANFVTEDELQKQEKKKSTKRGQTKKDGEKLLDKVIQTMKGYNAIDSLIKKCSAYGSSIASQIQKWGVNVEDIQNGELNFIDIGEDDESEASDTESLIKDTPSVTNGNTVTKAKKSNGEGDDSDFEDDEEEDYEESEDEDYRATRKARASGRGRGKPKQSDVKFFKQKPKLLSPDVSLKDYQQTGINWLHLLYRNNLSCILADEMGLGKTCQVIAFLSYLKQNNEPGPHLVVVPSSTLENWLREFTKFCPEMKIEPYYGSQQERAELRDILEDNDGKYDVVVTTYNLASGNKYDVSFLKNRGFNVVVYDEGHMLKNSLSERFSKLMKIKANFRLLLTGTPLQNNLKELMSLLEFIMPSLFISKKDDLSAVFRQRARTSDSHKDYNPLLAQEAIARAKTMMKPFILRRKKDQVLKHLPRKHSKIEYCEMTEVQRSIYNREIQLVLEHKRTLAEGLEDDADSPEPKKNGKQMKSKMNISKNLIMSLRKASLHPLLFRHIYDNDVLDRMSRAILSEPEYAENGNKDYIQEDMSYMTDFELHKLCMKFPKALGKYQLKNDEWMNSGKVEALGKILKDIIENKKEKVLVFSLFTQMLDILELALTTLNINFLRLDGSTQVNDRQTLIDKFHDDDSIPVFILSTKAGGFGINLVCANHVIIFDQSFNPHDDRQAADRAHRVGQTKTVHITTLITHNSIEEKILQLAKNKLALDTHISEDDHKASEALESRVSDILEDIIYDENK